MDKNKKRKLRTGIVAALLMLLILLTGTYAWTQFNNVGFNALDVGTNFGGRFHDHFVWENGSEGFGEGTHNKDLFAENFGENRVFVRARLREFMTTGGVPIIAGTTVDNPLGTGVEGVEWPIYVSESDNPHTRRVDSLTARFGRNGIDWNLGHHNDKVFMPTFNHAEFNVEGAHIDGSVPPLFECVNAFEMIEATGMAVDGHTFDITAQEDARDILANGNQTGPGLMGHADSEITASTDEHGEHDHWEVGDALSSPRLIVDEYGVLRAINDPDTNEPFVHIARPTLSPENPTRDDVTLTHPVTNGVMTMQQWRQLGIPRGNFWVLDTDGWFYWASPLLTEQATSLLLDEITVKDIRDEGIEYVINVEAQFTNRTNIDENPEFDDMTEDAIDLWLMSPWIPDVAHETFTVEGSDTVWRVLLPDDGYGNALIITEYVHGPAVSFSAAPPYFRAFEGSNLQTVMNEWFNNTDNVGAQIRTAALNYEFQDTSGNVVQRTATIVDGTGSGIETDMIVTDGNVTDVVGGWYANDSAIAQWRLSANPDMRRAMTRPAGNPGSGQLFPLSVTEVQGYLGETNADRVTTLVNTTTSANWWLRSSGTHAGNPIRRIGPGGQIQGSVVAPSATQGFDSGSMAHGSVGIRPALWIRP